jgi:photosystem II stability/assembly factor-like uncharacterized protein
VAGLPSDTHTFFQGTTGGGIWKTDDAANSWSPITDGQLDVGPVGAIAVAPSDPNVIYAGTGSACIRGNVSTGRGVWKSTDGGKSWTMIGLPGSGAVGKILVHPDNPDLVYLAALGSPFGKNDERGVYRSSDGGKTWDKSLYLNDSTGSVSLAMNPKNPREIYAGMWRAERKPWMLISGSADGGVYKTTDGGDSWKKLEGGLPSGLTGKIGIDVSPANPERVWAIVEAEPDGGVYRSDDAGKTWTRVNSENKLRQRAWYYSHLTADPKDPNTVYALNTSLFRSVDAGVTFTEVQVPHGDTHDLWIDPDDTDIMALSDDGGVVVTLNGGASWSSLYNQPTAEFYEVEVDNQHPYRIYGSQQDNVAVSVPSNYQGHVLRPQQTVLFAAGCETGPTALHPDYPNILWGGCYGGSISRMEVDKDTRQMVRLYPEDQGVAPSELKYRFQWVAPIVVSRHDPNTVYHASQMLHRTRDGGMTWTTISPDLTTNDTTLQRYPGGPINADHTGVEVYTTIFALAEGLRDADELWVGSDDGRVHITRDGGATWTDITPSGMPRLGTVNRIELSTHAPGRALIAVQRYRMNDWTPYVFRTDDWGKTWIRITDGRNGIPANHIVRVVREDPARKGLLYAGTEFGAFVSFNDGGQWQQLQMNLPATPITDMKVHRGDLVISTQGRSFWVLDDLTPIRELAAARPTGATLFAPRDVSRGFQGLPFGFEMDHSLPETLPFGALVHYLLTERAQEVTVEIRDGTGAVVRSFSSDSARADSLRTQRLETIPGLHRVVWNLTSPGPVPPKGVPGGGPGPKAVPGSYSAFLSVDGKTSSRPFRVTGDPNVASTTQADYEEQYRVARAVRDTLEQLYRQVERVRSVKEQVMAILDRAAEAGKAVGDAKPLGDSLTARLSALEGELIQTKIQSGQDGLRFPAKLDAEYGTLLQYVAGNGGYGGGSPEGRPSQGVFDRQRDLDPAWNTIRARLERVWTHDLPAFNRAVVERQLGGVVVR